jgi:hypothetical protein
LTSYFEEQIALFKQKKLDAAATLEAGEYPMVPLPDIDSAAALMKTINAIYNMEEAITKT